MKSLLYTAPKKFSIVEVETPKCGKGQVLIRVRSCGICKTDVHIHNGQFLSRFPLTPGHEFAGEVVEVGDEVTDFSKGARVVADNTVLCGECYYCRRNQPLYCQNFYSLGVTGPGGFAEYVAVNHEKVFPIRADTSFDTAAFTEPTACAVHGMDMIDLHCGDDVLLFGSGATGIILAQLIRFGGAGNMLVAAPSEFKLKILKEMGINTVKIDRNDHVANERHIKELYPGGFDVIIDATGDSSITEQCIKFSRKGSKIVVYGVCDEKDRIAISPYEIFSKELKIIGSFAQTHCFDRAIKYLENGTVRVDKLTTHHFRLDEYEKGLNTVMDGSKSIKVLINP